MCFGLLLGILARGQFSSIVLIEAAIFGIMTVNEAFITLFAAQRAQYLQIWLAPLFGGLLLLAA